MSRHQTGTPEDQPGVLSAAAARQTGRAEDEQSQRAPGAGAHHQQTLRLPGNKFIKFFGTASKWNTAHFPLWMRY